MWVETGKVGYYFLPDNSICFDFEISLVTIELPIYSFVEWLPVSQSVDGDNICDVSPPLSEYSAISFISFLNESSASYHRAKFTIIFLEIISLLLSVFFLACSTIKRIFIKFILKETLLAKLR